MNSTLAPQPSDETPTEHDIAYRVYNLYVPVAANRRTTWTTGCKRKGQRERSRRVSVPTSTVSRSRLAHAGGVWIRTLQGRPNMDTTKRIVEPQKNPPQPIKAQPKPEQKKDEHHADGYCEPKAKV